MLRQFSILSACALLLAACGGGGSGASSQAVATTPTPPTDLSFTLTSTDPADGAGAVPRNTTFNAVFSDTVAPGSVSATSAKLIGPEGNVIAANANVSAATVSFTTPMGLPGNTSYHVEFAASVASAKGTALGNTVSRGFTTAPQSWQPGTTAIGSLPYFTGNTSPIVQADRDGNVTAVWLQSPSRIDTITTSRMDAKTGTWSTPMNLAVSDPSGGFGGLTMAVAAKGDVYVAWTEYLAGSETDRIEHYDPVSGSWSALPLITAPAATEMFRLVTDAAGNLTAVVLNGGVYAVGFNAAAGVWQTPVRIDAPDVPALLLQDLGVVADGKGGLVVGWVQESPDGQALYVTQNSSGNWSTPQRLDAGVLTGLFPSFSLAVNPSGSAAISWAHNYGMAGNPTVMASTFAGGSATWNTAVRLDQMSPVFGAQHPWTVVDAAGIATTVWSEYEGLFASRYSAATGTWSPPQRVHDNGASPVAVVDPAGNVMVVQASSLSLQAAQYLVADGQWHESRFGQPAAGDANAMNPPAVTIDASGTVTVAWFAWNTVNGASQYPVSVNRFQ